MTTPGATEAVTPEQRATMFIEWCALSGFDLQGWPDGAHRQLTLHLREAEANALRRAAEECERHLEFLRKEAHAGGDFHHLIARADEAAYLAKRIRSILSKEETAKPTCQTMLVVLRSNLSTMIEQRERFVRAEMTHAELDVAIARTKEVLAKYGT